MGMVNGDCVHSYLVFVIKKAITFTIQKLGISAPYLFKSGKGGGGGGLSPLRSHLLQPRLKYMYIKCSP